MDTSKNYVKMCERAMEIQEEWKKEVRVGDIFVHGPSSVQWSLVCEKITVVQVSAPPYFSYRIDHDIGGHWAFPNHETLTKGYFIWLPRQDQLQEMLPRKTQLQVFSWDEMGWSINDNLRGETWKFWEAFDNGELSWEQIWLRFVMQELFSKTWDRQDWVKEG